MLGPSVMSHPSIICGPRPPPPPTAAAPPRLLQAAAFPATITSPSPAAVVVVVLRLQGIAKRDLREVQCLLSMAEHFAALGHFRVETLVGLRGGIHRAELLEPPVHALLGDTIPTNGHAELAVDQAERLAHHAQVTNDTNRHPGRGIRTVSEERLNSSSILVHE